MDPEKELNSIFDLIFRQRGYDFFLVLKKMSEFKEKEMARKTTVLNQKNECETKQSKKKEQKAETEAAAKKKELDQNNSKRKQSRKEKIKHESKENEMTVKNKKPVENSKPETKQSRKRTSRSEQSKEKKKREESSEEEKPPSMRGKRKATSSTVEPTKKQAKETKTKEDLPPKRKRGRPWPAKSDKSVAASTRSNLQLKVALKQVKSPTKSEDSTPMKESTNKQTTLKTWPQLVARRKSVAYDHIEHVVADSSSDSESNDHLKGKAIKREIDDPTFKVDLSAPKIMFTKFDSDQFDRDIIQLGGIIEQSPEAASVLVSENVRRTCKFMCAMIRGIPIVTPEWIRQSIKAKKFIAVDHYIVRDMAAEKKFSFNMVVSLKKAPTHKIFDNYEVFITPSVKPPPNEISVVVELGGGVCMTEFSDDVDPNKNILLVTNIADEHLWGNYVSNYPNIKIIIPEGIMRSVMKQHVNLTKFILHKSTK